MIKRIICLFVILVINCHVAQAISERHLILIRHGEADHNLLGTFNSNPKHPNYKQANLTDYGKQQAKQTAERLVLHGFDNRNIAAVYVSPLPRTVQTAEKIAEYGVFTKDKIHVDTRLIESNAGDLENELQDKFMQDAWHVSEDDHQKYRLETNQQVRHRVLKIYDEVEKKYPNGHVIFITHGMPAMELLQDIVQIEVKLETAEAYLLPLVARG